MFPDWTWIVGFAIGAAIGSFLNVVIYRLPRNLKLYEPAHSFCPKCKHSLGAADLIPLLSWLLSRGKCRHCGDKVSSRYFWVEIATGLVWGGVWYQYLVQGDDWVRAIVYALGASALIAIIFIDIELYIIPDQINAFLWFLGIAYNVYLFVIGSPQAMTWGIPTALAGWLVGVGALWGIAMFGRLLFGKDAMGHGDIKMTRGVGAILGPAPALISFGLAVVLGAVIGGVQAYVRNAATKAQVRQGGASTEPEPELDEPYEPESIGSLLKSGLGYVLCIDIMGLFVPKWYESWFGEPLEQPFEVIEEYPIEETMIPFGPYLALGAIVATVYQGFLIKQVEAYLNYASR